MKREMPRHSAESLSYDDWCSWFNSRINDILCGLIEGATCEKTKAALYEFVQEHFFDRPEHRAPYGLK